MAPFLLDLVLLLLGECYLQSEGSGSEHFSRSIFSAYPQILANFSLSSVPWTKATKSTTTSKASNLAKPDI